ncbi:hypothetical protein [Henriciella sp.]|uniref:hypothetical protein n=1 Tax=Henriciella sp. TaxID=1968823 RepID=UPI002627A8FB|nr:hypothetical protein [Henriciella sp.]
MSEKYSRKIVTSQVPVHVLEEYLHDATAWQAIMPRLAIDEFTNGSSGVDGSRRSKIVGAMHASIGIFPFEATVQSQKDGDVLVFDGKGLLAKLAPFSLSGEATNQEDGNTEVQIKPAFEKLPHVLQKLLQRVEGSLHKQFRDRVDRYYANPEV